MSNNFCENSVMIKISVIWQTQATVVHVTGKGFFCKKIFFLHTKKFPEKSNRQCTENLLQATGQIQGQVQP